MGQQLGGIIVDGGKFDWNSPKFPGFTEPDPSYHDIVYAEAIGAAAYIIKARVQLLRDLGPALSPQNAFQFILGLETLHVRMKEHVANTKEVVEYLEAILLLNGYRIQDMKHILIKNLADKYLPKGAGSVVVFGIEGGREAGAKLINSIYTYGHMLPMLGMRKA